METRAGSADGELQQGRKYKAPGFGWEERGERMLQLRNRQKGQGLVEYALIIALVAIVVIAILVLMGPQIGDIFSNITHGL